MFFWGVWMVFLRLSVVLVFLGIGITGFSLSVLAELLDKKDIWIELKNNLIGINLAD